MKFNITHNTVYLFDSEVFLEHYLRFRPKQTPYLITDFSITICQNSRTKVIQDEENNILDFAGLRGTTKLTITVF
jgi:hypothetical protein